ncbi:hypothetical protein LIR37_20985 [Flavonifractor plautii]|uniref:hypothetical protein n=1 Tax=Flavonifractor plautii TaxID=292800 RepID=UPI001D00CCA3|nr:hypothetical protein [Flavonifractor plautii]MCB5856817.1 hypothetical protein [Flavonifractor plautii]
MAEQEKKAGKILSEDAWRKAIQSMKAGKSPADSDPFKGNMPKGGVPDRFKRK